MNRSTESDKTDWNWTEVITASTDPPSKATGHKRVMNESGAHFTSFLTLCVFFPPSSHHVLIQNLTWTILFCVVLTATQEKLAGILSPEHVRWTNKHAHTWNASACSGHKTHRVRTKQQTHKCRWARFSLPVLMRVRQLTFNTTTTTSTTHYICLSAAVTSSRVVTPVRSTGPWERMPG